MKTTVFRVFPRSHVSFAAGLFGALLFSPISPVRAGSGGGGASEYSATWIDSLEANGPVYQWVDIGQTGEEVLGYGDGSTAATVDLEVPTVFYTFEVADQVVVSESGYLTTDLSDNGSDSTNDCGLPVAPSNGGSGERVYVLHDEIDFAPSQAGGGGRGQILYEYFPRSPHPANDCGVQVFSWLNMERDRNGQRFDFQLLVFDNFDILMQYGPGNPDNGAGSTTGLQDDTFGFGLEIACDTANSIPDNYAVLVEPNTVVVDLATDEVNSLSMTTLREALDSDARKIVFDPSLDGAVIERNVLEGNPPYNVFEKAIDASGLPRGITLSGVDTLPLAKGFDRAHFENITFKQSLGTALILDDNGSGSLDSYTVFDCRFRQNNGTTGGALFVDTIASNLPIRAQVTDCKFISNTATDEGGAIHGQDGSEVFLYGCTFTANESGEGGAVSMRGSSSILSCHDGCEFNRNTSTVSGGGAVKVFEGSFFAEDCSFDGNESSDGTPLLGSAFFILSGADGEVERCTFSNNGGSSALRFEGDGTLTNSTISGSAENGIGFAGAWALIMSHCTVAENGGVGLSSASGALVSVSHTIFSNNGVSIGDSGSSTIVSAGFNLSDEDSPFLDVSSDDIENVDPLLLPLAFNGGLTQTHGFQFGSPAMDSGRLFPPSVSTDQRGIDRVLDGDGNGVSRIDIGAYEFVEAVVVTTDVDEVLDPGTGLSLREAIAEAGSGGFIRIAPGLNGETIRLDSSSGGQGVPVDVDKSITIDASLLTEGVTISGGGETGVMDVDGVSLTLLQVNLIQGLRADDGGALRLTNGASVSMVDGSVRGSVADNSHGGGVYVGEGCSLDLQRCRISNNETTSSSPLSVQFGGGVYVDEGGSLIARATAFSRNVSSNHGGGIYTAAEASVELIRCTVSANEAATAGGLQFGTDGIYSMENTTVSANVATGAVGGMKLNGETSVRHCTIVDNRSGPGTVAGVEVAFVDSDLSHSILAANRNDVGVWNLLEIGFADLVSLGYNLIDTTELTLTHPMDLIGFHPHLAPLGSYGGQVQTHPPLAISPVIDAGDNSIIDAPSADARGYDRITSGLGSPNLPRIDIGAVEAGEPVIVDTLADETALGATTSLREALDLAEDGDRILFDAALNGGEIDLSSTAGGEGDELEVGKDVEIDATSLPSGITVSGGDEVRVFNVLENQQVALHAVSVCDGSVSGDGGGIYSEGDLTVTHACIHRNEATGDGGGIAAPRGFLRLFNTTVSTNSVDGNGGAIKLSGFSSASLQHCTVSFNETSDASSTGGVALGAASLKAYSTIFSDNSNASGSDSFDATNSVPDQIESLGYNLTDLNALVAFDEVGDQVNVSPGLLFLVDSGGWSLVHTYVSTGPAADSGDPQLSKLNKFDARGFARVAAGTSDIGAFESLAVTEDGDGDGMPDWWEYLHGLNPGIFADASEDPDGDGDDNLTEFQNGTNPRDVIFFQPLEIVSFALMNGGAEADITVLTNPGVIYTLEHSTDLQSWSQLTTIVGLEASDRTAFLINLNSFGVAGSKGFFRITR